MSRLFPFLGSNFYHHFYRIKVACMCSLLPSVWAVGATTGKPQMP